MTNEMKTKWNNIINEIDERLDNVGDAAEDAAENTSDWFSEQRNNLKSSYYDRVADHEDDVDDAFEARMKATEARAKAAGYKVSQDS